MRTPRLASFTELLVASAVATIVPTQEGTPLRRVEVFLNDRYLLSAHTPVSPTVSLGLDNSGVLYTEIERVLAGGEYLNRRGSYLDAVMPGAGTGAVLRVQRRGRVSSRLHRLGGQEYIPLLDLVRALGASIVRSSTDRINLLLESSRPDAILAANIPLERRRH